MTGIITAAQTGMPDLNPHGKQTHPTFAATIARVQEACHLGYAGVPEQYTWVILLDDDTCRAEIDDLGWSLHIDEPGLAARTRAFALIDTARPEGLLVGGIPAGFKAFFTRRRVIVVNSGESGTLCTIIGAVPLPGTTLPPGYLFADHLGQLHYSSDLNAITI